MLWFWIKCIKKEGQGNFNSLEGIREEIANKQKRVQKQ